jgi:hypothetical protein
MRPLALIVLLGLVAPLAADPGADAAAAPTPEKLAGEERALPTAVPTPAGDERGPISATRSAQAAPAFSLPAFVITGGGERKALASRDDAGEALDTSGGLKTSPGERGAGKDQREAQASREGSHEETYTARADYGQVRVAYGLDNCLDASVLGALESGRWFGWGEGQGAVDDGGPLSSQAIHAALRRGGAADLHLGWRASDQDILDASVAAQDRSVLWTHGAGNAPWIGSSGQQASLGWDAQALGMAYKARVSGGRWQQLAPSAAGGALDEGEAGLSLYAARSLNGRTGSALLEAGLQGSSLQEAWGPTRSLWQGQGWLQSRFEAWPGNRLGLGLQWDQVGGDAQAGLLGPKVSVEQRLWRDLGLQASFGTGLSLSRLGSAEGQALAGQPWRPDPTLAPAKRVADAKAALRWQGQGLTLGVEGAYTQDQDARLPDDPAGAGLWADAAVGDLQRWSVTAKQRLDRGAWWQELEVGAQQAQLPDRPAWKATFTAPYWVRAGVGAKAGSLSGELRLACLGPRDSSLTGTAPALGQAWDLGAKLSDELGPGVSVFAEGRNLLAQPVMDYPDFAQPAPYAGLGAELRF